MTDCPDCCTHCTNKGLLIIRVGLGILLALHGAQLLFGGAEVWTSMGEFVVGAFYPMIVGVIGAAILCLGGIFLIVGLFRRVTTILLGIVMLAAVYGHFQAQHPLFPTEETSAWHAINLAVVFFGLASIGAGRFKLGGSSSPEGTHTHDTPVAK